MANQVNITYSSAGLGTPSANQDLISGMIFYSPVVPSAFASGAIVNMLSIADAVAAGITNTSSGAAAMSGTCTVTASGSTGANIALSVSTLTGVVAVGSYTVIATDTLTTIATGLAAAINALTVTTGFYATASGAAVTVVAPLNLGLGAMSFTNVLSGGITATLGAFAGGTYSTIDPIYYQINQAFILNPQLQLSVMVLSASSASYAEISNMQLAQNGTIRQVAVIEPYVNYSSSNLALLQTQATAMYNQFMPLQVFYSCNFTGLTLSSAADLTLLTDQNVKVIAGGDGAAVGFGLFCATNKGICRSQIGAYLGSVSFCPVEQSPCQPGFLNLDIAGENDSLLIAGQAYTSLSANLINVLTNKAYTFLQKYVGLSGSFWNTDQTCSPITNVYSSMPLDRVIAKVARNVRANLLPLVASNVQFNGDGTVSIHTIANFEDASNAAMASMQSNGELSNYKTIINAKQPVQATKSIALSVNVQPLGYANDINVTLGFVIAI